VRAVFAVGSFGPGVPWDVFALFTSQREAQRHADAAAYVFRVFVLPVYEDYSEVPRAFRPPHTFRTHWLGAATDEVVLTAEALQDGEVEVVEAGTLVAAVDFEPPELGEVRLLFTHEEPAAPLIRETLEWGEGLLRTQRMPVYASYDDCPAEQRYAVPGPAFSQNVPPR